MALTIRDYTGNDTTTLHNVDFDLGYLSRSHIYVYLEGSSYQDQLSYVWVNSSQIELDTPVPSGQVYYIRRVTPRDEPVNDYEDGAILKEKNLDDSFAQTLMILEEIQDGFIQVEGDFLINAPVEIGGGAKIGGDTEIDGHLDMKNHQVKNVANAIDSNDAINWQQAVDLLAQGGLPVTTVTEEQELDSGQVVVTLTTVDATKSVFYISGIHTDSGRLSRNEYTIDSTTQITLDSSYPAGTRLLAVYNEASQDHKTTDYTDLVFKSVSDMKSGITQGGVDLLITMKDAMDEGPIKLSTQADTEGTEGGAADYLGMTLAAYQALRGAGAVPDGDNDHYLFGGTEYVAIAEIQAAGSTFMFEGDSITEGNAIGGFKYSDTFKTLRYASKRGVVRNVAVGGSWITGNPTGDNIVDRYATLVYPHRPAKNGGNGGSTAYLILMIGTNDLSVDYGNKDADTVVSQLTSYIDTARADGFTVLLQTITPRQIDAGWTIQAEQYRLDVNRRIKNREIPYDIMCDTASILVDPYGPLFNDVVHPTPQGANMIAYYLDAGLSAGDFIVTSSVDTLHSPKLGGKTTLLKGGYLELGNQYMSTAIGSDNGLETGFLIHTNLNASGVDQAKWQWSAGVSGNNLKFQTLNDSNSGVVDVFDVVRDGMNAVLEIGRTRQKLRLGLLNETGAGYLGIENMYEGLGADESLWEWSVSANSSDFSLRGVTDARDNSSPHITFRRNGRFATEAVIPGSFGTGQIPSESTTDTTWRLGQIRSGGPITVNTSKYVQVEINGELVNLAVVNDPTPT